MYIWVSKIVPTSRTIIVPTLHLIYARIDIYVKGVFSYGGFRVATKNSLKSL